MVDICHCFNTRSPTTWTSMMTILSSRIFHHSPFMLILLLLLLQHPLDVVQGCPDSCVCRRDESVAVCQKGEWSDIQDKLTTNLESLILDGGVTGLDTITTNTLLKHQKRLRTLKITDLSLKFIEPFAFAGFDALEVIDLSHNQLVNLDPDSFSGLSNVKTLVLANNKLSQLEGVLTPLVGLRTLDVTHNIIQDLSKSVFKNQSLLISLTMNGNRLERLMPQSFVGLRTVQDLRLRDCSIQSFEIDVFYETPKLKFLDLGQNRLSKPLSQTIIADIMFLNTLLFDHNELHRLEHKDFAHLNLQSLDLSYNRINYIERTAFQNLTVKELDLSDNRIVSLSTGFLAPLSSHLTSLRLAGNLFEKFESDTFSNFDSLERLNVSSCRLNIMNHETLSNMPLLKSLDVSHNNLYFLSQDSLNFINGLTNVNLHQNKWICDCEIKPLRDWLGKVESLTKFHCPPSRSKHQDCATLRCAAPSQLYHKLLHQLEKEDLGECLSDKDKSKLPASTQGAIVAACLGFAIIFLLITVYLWRKGKTGIKLKRVCVPSKAESSHMIDEDSKVPPLSNCDRVSLNESDHEFVVRHYFDTLVTDPKLMSRTSDSEEPKSPKERDSLYSSQPSLYSNPNGIGAAPMGIESTV